MLGCCTRTCTRTHTHTDKWSRYGFTRKLHDDKRIPEKQRTWKQKKKKKSEPFLSSDITTDPSEGGMCCSRCGMAEKIGKEHGVAEINRLAAVWKASMSFSPLNLIDIEKLTSELRWGMKKNQGRILTSLTYHQFERKIYEELKNAFTIWKCLNLGISSDQFVMK